MKKAMLACGLLLSLVLGAGMVSAKSKGPQKLLVPAGWELLDAQLGVGGARSFYTIRARDKASQKVYLLTYVAGGDEKPSFTAVIESASSEEVFGK